MHGTLLAIVGIALFIYSYYLFAEIETKKPEELDATCEIRTEQYMERKVFIITPIEKEKTETKILYFHGGSYVAEASEKHWEFIKKLVNDTGATVILPDYPLAPKYNYKDVFQMVVPLYKKIIEKVERTPLKFLNRNGKKTDGDYAFCVDTCHTGGIKEYYSDNSFKIRKLTPRECFRLMGMRDDDIDKIQQVGISNTQQYKMAGNSIVVDVLEAIFKNLFKGE